ncbi:MAG: hypothetical protein U9R68_05520 [Planctomycetota bacterium]|nr:hypothetical protein [Planctomycetota bacterium]
MPTPHGQTNADFEDMLRALAKHRARYLIVGGVAVCYHTKPRYTRDLDLWVDPTHANVERVNRALAEFGSPNLIDPGILDQILQIGVDPNRIDVLLSIPGVRYVTAWRKRVRGYYGDAHANYMDIDSLIRNKSRLDAPRHQEDVRLLKQEKRRRQREG